MQDTIHAEIYGLPGNWRWRSLTPQGETITSRQGYAAVASAVDAINALFGEDHPIEVVRLERSGREVCRHWHRGGDPT